MAERPPVNFGDGKEKVLEVLAEGNTEAIEILGWLMTTQDPMNALIDITDMNLRGMQIAFAFMYCGGEIENFITALLERNGDMVRYVNQKCPEMPRAREHGEQRRVSQVDFAVQSAMQAQNMDGVIERMDEGAEHVHNFFLTLLKQMQAARKFTINMRVNLGLEGGHTAVFAVSLAEILDKEGKPYAAQPQNEAADVARVHAEIAKERGDLPPIPPEMQKAIDEGRW